MNSVFRAFQRCDRFTPFAAIWICVIFGVSWPPQIYAANFQLPEFTLIDRGEADAIFPSVSSKFPGSRFAVTGLNSSMGTIRILRVENDKNCSAEFLSDIRCSRGVRMEGSINCQSGGHRRKAELGLSSDRLETKERIGNRPIRSPGKSNLPSSVGWAGRFEQRPHGAIRFAIAPYVTGASPTGSRHRGLGRRRDLRVGLADHAVAAVALGRVEAGVGALDQRMHGVAAAVGGDADRDGDAAEVL